MAETVVFGKTSKRINSTSQTYTPVITTNVLLKEPCSVMAPVFLVKQDYAALRECNYAEYAGFYYWITNVVSVRNKHCVISCVRDPLASFATAIQDVKAFAKFADLDHCNFELVDPRLSPEIISDASRRDIDIFTDVFDSAKKGTVILRTYSQYNVNTAGVRTYAVDYNDFRALLANMDSIITNDWSSVGSALNDVAMKLATSVFSSGSWKDTIVDCYWVPTAYSSFSNSPATKVAFGIYISQCDAYDIGALFEMKVPADYTVTIPLTVNTQRFPWLRSPEYTSVQINHPCGTQEIGCPELIHQNSLTLTLCYNRLAGDYLINVKIGPGHEQVITTISGSLRYDLLGLAKSSGYTIKDAIGETIATGASLVAGGAFDTKTSGVYLSSQTSLATDVVTENTDKINNIVQTVGTGIEGVFSKSGPRISTSSVALTNPGMLGLYKDGDRNWSNAFYISIISAYPRIIYDDVLDYVQFCARYGFPCNQYLRLGDVSGYIQCVGASADIEGATPTEIQTINSNINNGIYIEN